jgi:hypothetical protein
MARANERQVAIAQVLTSSLPGRFRGLWPGAALLVRAGFLVVLVPFDVPDSRPFWHATGTGHAGTV